MSPWRKGLGDGKDGKSEKRELHCVLCCLLVFVLLCACNCEQNERGSIAFIASNQLYLIEWLRSRWNEHEPSLNQEVSGSCRLLENVASGYIFAPKLHG